MAAPRLLPPTQELRKLVDAGLTHAEIAEWVKEHTGLIVSRSAVSSALHRAGLTAEAPRYKDELPWRVRAEHLTQYPARMLRLLGRRRAGIELGREDVIRLDAWLEGLEEQGLVVAYVPAGSGFIYVTADEVGDGKNGIPIRTRPIDLEELEE
jgi:hypothetical protein